MVSCFKILGQLVTFQGHVNFWFIDLTLEGQVRYVFFRGPSSTRSHFSKFCQHSPLLLNGEQKKMILPDVKKMLLFA